MTYPKALKVRRKLCRAENQFEFCPHFGIDVIHRDGKSKLNEAGDTEMGFADATGDDAAKM